MKSNDSPEIPCVHVEPQGDLSVRRCEVQEQHSHAHIPALPFARKRRKYCRCKVPGLLDSVPTDPLVFWREESGKRPLGVGKGAAGGETEVSERAFGSGVVGGCSSGTGEGGASVEVRVRGGTDGRRREA